mgnify:CR=1 FL=1
MAVNEKYDFTIEQLGPCKIKSPIELSSVVGDYSANYVHDDSYVRNKVNVYTTDEPNSLDASNLLQKAGPAFVLVESVGMLSAVSRIRTIAMGV